MNFMISLTRPFLSIFFAFCIMSANSIGKELQSGWVSTPIEVDGSMKEWSELSKSYFEKENVLVGLSNDGDNLYILFRFGNETWARAIRMSGVKVWFDNSGKKEKIVGIKYTGGAPPSGMPPPGANDPEGLEGKAPEMPDGRIELERGPMGDQIAIIQEGESEEVMLSADGSDGINVRSCSDRKFFTYEFSVPLKAIEGLPYAIGTEPGKTIGIVLEWGEVSEEDLQRMKEQMGDRMGKGSPGGKEGSGGSDRSGGRGSAPPGGGMGPRGGMGPGAGGPPPGFSQQNNEKQELKLKVLLALPLK